MKVILPFLKRIAKHPSVTLFNLIEKLREIDAEVDVLERENYKALIVKQEAFELLVRIEGNYSRLEDKYNYVIASRGLIFSNKDVLDLSKFSWLKHPLQNDSYYRKHSKEYILNSWIDNFSYKLETEETKGLRPPQIGALHALRAHWIVSNEIATVVLPTGTGKTETMLSTMISNQTGCLLVVVPTDALRNQLANKFITLGILPEFGVVSNDCELPIVGVMKHTFNSESDVKNIFTQLNVCIATMAVLSACTSDIQNEIANHITHLFIDEAHHTPAKTWNKFKSKFEKSKIVQFTATPFRNDGKRLEGKIIFNYPLKRAQEEGYFKPINFKPISEFDKKYADISIAQCAVKQLEDDLSSGYDHLLMVRVNEISRATEVFEHYKSFTEYHPIIIHSQLKPKKLLDDTIKAIVEKKHRIIICVDMLGEGFDLPELKIAAFHDTKKSLAVTLQIAGRFTRAKSNLGPATFIANIADAEVTEDLEDLYYKDSDWNSLLPDMSFRMTLEQEDFRDFVKGFKSLPSKFPIQAIKHPLSTLIFQCETNTWMPLQFKSGIRTIDSYDYVYGDYNNEKEVLIVILGKKSPVHWAKIEEFESVSWDLIVCHFDTKTKLLYLHTSNTNSNYERFATGIATNSILLKGQNLFRCFAKVNRLRLHNVGVRVPMGRAMNYIMRVGSDIKTALTQTEINQAIKSNIFGVGYENGSKCSIGCSHNGRIWSMRVNSIPTWIKWCKSISKKISDNSIDPNIVLKGTLIPKEVETLPNTVPFSIEWPDFIYRDSMSNITIEISNQTYPIWKCDLSLSSSTDNEINFFLELPGDKIKIKLKLVSDSIDKFSFVSEKPISIVIGSKPPLSLTSFFTSYPPHIYFVDGTFLEGNLYTEITSIIPVYETSNLSSYLWEGVNIKRESQSFEKHIDSIQYYVIEKLKNNKRYIVLMDDDDKGEMGDIVGFEINEREKKLNIDVFHCKYSQENKPGLRVKDFFEVCGQAQKAIKWMENIDEIFKHLLRRSQDRERRTGVSRFEIGGVDTLDTLRRRARKDLKVNINMIIVQPGLSKTLYHEQSDVSKLLAVVETYLSETWGSSMKVFCSP